MESGADLLRPRHPPLVRNGSRAEPRPPTSAGDRVRGTGEDELAAMIDLRIRLDDRRRAEKLEAIERRGRAAFLEGAEAQSQAAEGRPLTADVLERVTERYPPE